MLGERERALYARQILLPEIGMAGQQRLCQAGAALAPPANAEADSEADGWARAYLVRGGLRVTDHAATQAQAAGAPLPGPADVDALAGDPGLRHAAAALAGSLAAVEAIKAVLNVGAPGDPASGLTLAPATGTDAPDPRTTNSKKTR